MEASQYKSATPSLVWWSTQENHSCRVPAQAGGLEVTLIRNQVWTFKSVQRGQRDGQMLKSHSPFPQVLEHLLIIGLHTYTGSFCVSVSDLRRPWSCLQKIVDPT